MFFFFFSERIKTFSEAEEIGERFPLPAWKAKIRKAFIPSCSRTKGLPDQYRCFIKKRQSVHLFANQHTKIQQANHLYIKKHHIFQLVNQSMAISNSYVRLPEGKPKASLTRHRKLRATASAGFADMIHVGHPLRWSSMRTSQHIKEKNTPTKIES